jgi:2-polyprenyl-6-methoxyphenol hydroxylase-like FAD-dependent oxidoreductase
MAAARALIIGGGIGGLCAAIALRRGGIDAQVFEMITRASRRFGAASQWENPCLCWLREVITKSGVARRYTLKQFEEMLGYVVPASRGA